MAFRCGSRKRQKLVPRIREDGFILGGLLRFRESTSF